MKKIVLLVFVLVFLSLAVALLATVFWHPSHSHPPSGWSKEAANYRDDYLFCIVTRTSVAMCPKPEEAVTLIICMSEKLANITDGRIDLVDVRAVPVVYMIDKGYYIGDYSDGCAALRSWEEACNVPYPIDCSEILNFIDTYHDDIAAAIDLCS